MEFRGTPCFRYNMRDLQRMATDLLVKNRTRIMKASPSSSLAKATSDIPENVRGILGLE